MDVVMWSAERKGGFEERGVDTNGDCCANATMMASL